MNDIINNNNGTFFNGKKTKLESQTEMLAKLGIFKLNFPVAFTEVPTYLKDFQCPHCNCYFAEQDISLNNYNLWVNNEVSEITKEDNIYGLGDGKPAYEMNFRLRIVEHRICPLEGGSN